MLNFLKVFTLFSVVTLSAPLWPLSVSDSMFLDQKSEVGPQPIKSITGKPLPVKSLTSKTLPGKKSVLPPDWARCPQYWPTALAVGWKRKDLKTLDMLMYRESRCQPGAYNKSDPVGGSRGILQINGFWHKILTQQRIMTLPEDLHDPKVNLRAALVIYNIQQNHDGKGWAPWASSLK